MGCGKSSSKREVRNDTDLLQETREISNNLTLHLKQLQKEKRSQKLVEENDNDKSEDKLETTPSKIKKINKNKSLFFENINRLDEPLTRLIKEKKGLK